MMGNTAAMGEGVIPDDPFGKKAAKQDSYFDLRTRAGKASHEADEYEKTYGSEEASIHSVFRHNDAISAHKRSMRYALSQSDRRYHRDKINHHQSAVSKLVGNRPMEAVQERFAGLVERIASFRNLKTPAMQPMPHPHEGRPYHQRGADLPTQYHGGFTQVRSVDASKLDPQGTGSKLGKGFYTVSSRDIANRRTDDVRAKRQETRPSTLTVKKAHPTASVLRAGKTEQNSHPQLVQDVKQFSPKYAKNGDMGMGDCTWVNQVNKFAEHHKYDAVRFDLDAPAGHVEHNQHVTVWKNHDSNKLVHVNHGTAVKKGFKAIGEDTATAVAKKRKVTWSTDPEKRERQKKHIAAAMAKKREKEAWARGDEEEKAWLASQHHHESAAALDYVNADPDRAVGRVPLQQRVAASRVASAEHAERNLKAVGDAKIAVFHKHGGACDSPCTRGHEAEHKYVLHQSSKNPGQWQITHMDRQGPASDVQSPSKEAAIRTLSGQHTPEHGLPYGSTAWHAEPYDHERHKNLFEWLPAARQGISEAKAPKTAAPAAAKPAKPAKKQRWELPDMPHHEHIVKMYDAADHDTKKYGHEWYETAHHIAKKLGDGHDNGTHKAAGALSAYSPRTNWGRSIMHATKAMKNGAGHGGPGHGAPATQGKQAHRIIAGGEHHQKVLGGEKTKSFAELIEHGGKHPTDSSKHSERVVVDRHAASIAIGKRLTNHDVNGPQGKWSLIWKNSKKGQHHYKAISDAYQHAAKHISERDGTHVAPHQVQATTWEHYRKTQGISDKESGGSFTGKRVSRESWLKTQKPVKKKKLKESFFRDMEFNEEIFDLGRPFSDDEYNENEYFDADGNALAEELDEALFTVAGLRDIALSEKAGPFKFCSTQIDIDWPHRDVILDFNRKIIPDHVLAKESVSWAEDGREDDVHVTVKYGLHEGDPEELKKILEGEGPVKMRIGALKHFAANEKRNSDVIVLEIESEDLHRLNEKISKGVECTDTYKGYKPHLTLAYVTPGLGKEYEGKRHPLYGRVIVAEWIQVSQRDGEKVSIQLKKTENVTESEQRHNDILDALPVNEAKCGSARVLYHGSGREINGALKPELVPSKDRKVQKAVVFGTDNIAAASLFMMPESALCSFGFEEGKVFACVWGTHKGFKDKPGYLYTLPSDTFKKGPKAYEWVSPTKVQPTEVRKYQSALEGMKRNGVEVYFINDDKTFDAIQATKTHRLPILRKSGIKPERNAVSEAAWDIDYTPQNLHDRLFENGFRLTENQLPIREVKNIRRYEEHGYEVRTETIDGSQYGGGDVDLESAYTLRGDYLGDAKFAKSICAKRGIIPEKAEPEHNICTIGFNPREQKWYGWSHRAIYGFGVGSIVKEGSVIAGGLESNPEFPVGYEAKSLEDAKRMAKAFAREVS